MVEILCHVCGKLLDNRILMNENCMCALETCNNYIHPSCSFQLVFENNTFLNDKVPVKIEETIPFNLSEKKKMILNACSEKCRPKITEKINSIYNK